MSNPYGKKNISGKAVINIDLTEIIDSSSDDEININSYSHPNNINMNGLAPGTFVRYNNGGGGVEEVITLSSDDDEVECIEEPSFTNMSVNIVNPFSTYNICIPFITEEDRADIYLLREQTPEHILEKIEQNYDIVLDTIRDLFIRQGLIQEDGEIGLVRIGYFKLTYNGNIPRLSDRLHVQIVKDPRIIPGFMGVHRDNKLHYLTYDDFINLLENISITRASYSDMDIGEQNSRSTRSSASTASSGTGSFDFKTLFQGLIEKTVYEIFIKKNLKTDSSFEQFIAIDLYPNRSKGSANFFHLDATPEMDTTFFTLTYLLPPEIKIKGPTVVTKSNIPVRNQVTLLVENGTTIGIDNDVVLHSTADPIVRVLPEKSGNFPIHGRPNIHGDFYLHTEPKTEIGIMPEDIRRATSIVEEMTMETDRKFTRTWFIRAFREGNRQGIDPRNLRSVRCNVDISYLKIMIRKFKKTTNVIVIDSLIDPNIIIGIKSIQSSSLGGGKMLINNLPSLQTPYSLQSSQLYEKNNIQQNNIQKSISINISDEFTQMFNNLLNNSFIIRKSGNLILGKKSNKGGKKIKYKKTKKVRKNNKSNKFKKSKKNRKIRKNNKK